MKLERALLGIVLAAAPALARAQAPTTTSTQVTAVRAAPVGFRAEYAAGVDEVGQQLVALAQAIPAEKFSWRPAPGVRSVSEVYVHVAQGNSMLPTFLGVKRMDALSRESEKTVTDKASVVELLKASIQNARAAAASLSDGDLEKKVKFFGREMTQRQLLVHILNHMHEHLGQSIAYARINGVTPPWSKTE